MTRHLPPLLCAAIVTLVLVLPPAFAGPGAHGPNGEHLDAPEPTRAASALPQVEAHTEAFELVAQLRATELTILIDRYDTNEPVLGARLEVESGGLKAIAKFRAESGDYVVADAGLLKALAAAGEHALVFTLVAGPDSDLLDGTLRTTAASAPASGHGPGDHGHDHYVDFGRAAWIGGAIAALGLLGGITWWRQRRGGTGRLQGGL